MSENLLPSQRILLGSILMLGVFFVTILYAEGTPLTGSSSSTNVSLTIVASGSILSSSSSDSSSSDSSSSVSSSSSSDSSSSAASSVSSSSTSSSSAPSGTSASSSSTPTGQYRYTPESTMKRILPLLRQRFRTAAPAKPGTPPTQKPYVAPRPPRPSILSPLEFGKSLEDDLMNFFLFLPFGGPVVEPSFLHAAPAALDNGVVWSDEQGYGSVWLWDDAQPAVVQNPEDIEPNDQNWVSSTSDQELNTGTLWQWIAPTGPVSQPVEIVLWSIFGTVSFFVLIFWRRLMDRFVNILLGIHGTIGVSPHLQKM